MGPHAGTRRLPLVAPLLRLARRGSLLIATDFDGTIAPVVRDPKRARPLPEASRALAQLAAKTPVAVISARDLANLAQQCPIPGVLLLGSYGLEPWMRLTSDERLPDRPPPSERLVRLARDLQDLTDWLPGVQVETKAMGVAVHYRNSPEPRRAAQLVRRMVDQVASHEGLDVVRGKLVVELRPPRSGNKGTALAAILDRLEPRGCVFAGDDLGDLPAMEELHRRRQDMELALAIGILGQDGSPRLGEVADRCLDGPRAWAELLQQLADSLPRGARLSPAPIAPEDRSSPAAGR